MLAANSPLDHSGNGNRYPAALCKDMIGQHLRCRGQEECTDMRTGIDLAESELNAHEKQIVAAVRSDGWFGTHVTSGEGAPAFSYTIGFWKTLGLPEILTFSLPGKTAHGSFWALYDLCKASGALPIATPVPEILNNVDVQFFPLGDTARRKYMLSDTWFYCGDKFPCLQMVWPDFQNVFPWQPGFSSHFEGQQSDETRDGWTRSSN
jgi:hypothetical protein